MASSDVQLTYNFRWRVGDGGIVHDLATGDTVYKRAVILEPKEAEGQMRDITIHSKGGITIGPVITWPPA